ncbi:MAG: LmbE family protein [Candidatus Peregrinibacteria bacterium GW2011_GWC2_39_14]|nr:MAG: hypothetical protein US92_C0005G0108 [Candidatus Peregrinibacteria bacterium GW2011_GWA2_38_36]KKR06657.1 MAG: LmbE family protein [Candidatus Peregrinibacteria bacterium GW2011_GWC2_39_14]
MNNSLIIAPHPDDSPLACGGTIVKILLEGGDVRVVNMTDGRNSHLATFGISEKPTPDELAEIRRNEELDSASVLGIPHGNLTFLGFEDGALGKYVEEAKEELIRILSANFPDEIYVPARTDRHPDHVAANLAIMAALRELQRPVAVLEYTTWTKSHLDTDDRVQPVLAHEGLVRVNDITGFLGLKRLAIEQHQSQIALNPRWPLQAKPVLDEDFLRPYFERPMERFVETRMF